MYNPTNITKQEITSHLNSLIIEKITLMRLKLAQTCVYMSQKHIYFKTNINVDPHCLLSFISGLPFDRQISVFGKIYSLFVRKKYITNGIIFKC